jgi:hypothetical protein
VGIGRLGDADEDGCDTGGGTVRGAGATSVELLCCRGGTYWPQSDGDGTAASSELRPTGLCDGRPPDPDPNTIPAISRAGTTIRAATRVIPYRNGRTSNRLQRRRSIAVRFERLVLLCRPSTPSSVARNVVIRAHLR